MDAHSMSDSSDGTKCAADHGPRRNVREREVEWSALMHSADAGDGAAYSRLLEEITPTLRATAERELVRAGLPAVRREAIVQEILLAVHLKRHIQSLPHRQRHVLRTIFSECVSVRETAAKLMMSERAVRVALRRGLSGVADRMGSADANRFS